MMIIIFGEQPPVYSVAAPANHSANPSGGYPAAAGNTFSTVRENEKSTYGNFYRIPPLSHVRRGLPNSHPVPAIPSSWRSQRTNSCPVSRPLSCRISSLSNWECQCWLSALSSPHGIYYPAVNGNDFGRSYSRFAALSCGG